MESQTGGYTPANVMLARMYLQSKPDRGKLLFYILFIKKKKKINSASFYQRERAFIFSIFKPIEIGVPSIHDFYTIFQCFFIKEEFH